MADYPEIESQRHHLDACVTCGICHSVCPTYLLSGRELLSPRGRILLLRRLLEGDIRPEEIGADAFDFCALCYACQTACPAGVRTDLLFIAARKTLADARGLDRRKALLFRTLEKPRHVELAVGVAALARKLFGRRVVDTVAGGVHVPDLRVRPLLHELPDVIPAEGKRRCRVGFFLGCISNYVRERPARAALEVLRRLGCEIVIPKGQVCCGAPAFNNGDFDTPRRLAEVNLRLFHEAGVDAVVSPDATCGGAFRHELPALLAGDDLYPLALEMRDKTHDWAGFVLDVLDPTFPETTAPPLRVTVHDSCHLAHTQHVENKVRELLARLPGVEIHEMAESDICCGFGGSFSSLYPEEAQRWTGRKVDNILATGTAVAVASSPGCIEQIRTNLSARDEAAGVKVKHPAEVIAERCGWLPVE